jgi:hypothetical protein
MNSNYNCSYMAMSSLTYIPGYSVKFFFLPIKSAERKISQKNMEYMLKLLLAM